MQGNLRLTNCEGMVLHISTRQLNVKYNCGVNEKSVMFFLIKLHLLHMNVQELNVLYTFAVNVQYWNR